MIQTLSPWLIAIAKFLLASGALFLFYKGLFRKKASYTESRVFLLSVTVLALLVSQFRLPITPTKVVYREVVTNVPTPSSAGATQTDLTPLLASDATRAKVGQPASPSVLEVWWQRTSAWVVEHPVSLLWLVYGLVAAILLINLMIQYAHILGLRRTGRVSHRDGYRLVETSAVTTPFSFARTIFLPTNLSDNQRDIVLVHEQWHIRHKHYVDVLFNEVLSCLCWFNPVQWLLRKELRSVHEFQADRSVLNDGCDLYRYQTIILEEVMGNHFRLANGFNHSFTKKRFIQMKQTEPSKLALQHKGLLFASLIVLFAVFSFVPGHSQVITVEKKVAMGDTVTTETVTMAIDSMFSPLNLMASTTGTTGMQGFSSGLSGNALQQSYLLSIDSLQHVVNAILPQVRRLAKKANPGNDAAGMNALMEAMDMRGNGVPVDYKNFSDETKASFTQDDFKDFQRVLENMDDSLRLYRTYKVESMDSPHLMKPALLAAGLLNNPFVAKVLPELFKAMMGGMASMMEGMTSAFSGDGSSSEVLDGEVLDGGIGAGMGEAMGEAFKQLGQVMGQMVDTVYYNTTTSRVTNAQTNNRSVGNRSKQATNNSKPKVSGADQGALANIAFNDEDPQVRMTAVKSLTDQGALAHVAFNDKDFVVRGTAVERLTDQGALAHVAFNDKDLTVRHKAVKRLSDQGALAHVAFNDKEYSVRGTAVERLRDQGALAHVAFNDKDLSVRHEAVKRLTDQGALAHVAFNDKEPSVRMAAIERLKDSGALHHVIATDKDPNVRRAATERLGKVGR
jgi:beta-lactamase regulating signal transducer with metallopeptidase domain